MTTQDTHATQTTTTAAERFERAHAAREQARRALADVKATIKHHQFELDECARKQIQAKSRLAAAERQADAAAAAIVDHHAALMVASGSADEPASQAALEAATNVHTDARQALQDARAHLQQVEASAQSDEGQIRANLAGDESRAADLERLVASLDRQVKAHGEQAAREHTRAAVDEIVGAWTAYLDTLLKWAKSPGAVGLWDHGTYLPNVLCPQTYNKTYIEQLLLANGEYNTQRAAAALGQIKDNAAAFATAAKGQLDAAKGPSNG